MNRQFVAVQFAGGGRPYTYHHDGAPLAVGEEVVVPTQRGEQKVKVASIVDQPPPFATKAVLRKVPAE